MLTYTTTSRAGRWIGVAVLAAALSFGSIAGPAIAAPSDIDRILVDTNVARAAQGLPALKQNTAIDAVAQAWAQKMASDGFVHNPSYSTQIPAGWSLASENIAAGYSSATVVDAWLNSPGHRVNIMSAATDIGIGFFVAPNGTAYSVQNFAQYPPSTAPAALTATPVPTVTGSVILGRTLTASAGVWGPSPVSVAFQWSAGGVKIAGATAPTYVPVMADLGKRLTVTVTGTKLGYTTVAQISAATVAVKATLTATPTPIITGTAQAGQIVTANPGNWSPAPVTLLYQWRRSGVAITGATTPSYTLGAADVGATVTVTVTGTKLNYIPVARKSQPTAVIVG